MAGIFNIPSKGYYKFKNESGYHNPAYDSGYATRESSPTPFKSSEFGRVQTKEKALSEDLSYRVYRDTKETYLNINCSGNVTTLPHKEAKFFLDNIDAGTSKKLNTKTHEIEIEKLTKGWTNLKTTDSRTRSQTTLLYDSNQKRLLDKEAKSIKTEIDSMSHRPSWQRSPFTNFLSNSSSYSSVQSTPSDTQAPWERSPFS